MQKICRQCGIGFQVTDDDLVFYEKVSPVFPSIRRGGLGTGSGKKYLIPPPTLCPECRQQRRLAWRNERALYLRTCTKTGKEIISQYSPYSACPVYERTVWWQNTEDRREYGREFDFSRPFFEQFQELLFSVPQFSIYHIGTNENSDYCSYALDTKNCYLSYSVVTSEECFYSHSTNDCKNCIDSFNVERSELLYECIDCSRCYHCLFAQNCVGSSDCFFCLECINCQNCFGCVNLQNARYCWFNEQLTKEQYQEKMLSVQQWTGESLQNMKERFHAFSLSHSRRFAHLLNTEHATGDYIMNSKDCKECYDCHHAENFAYMIRSFKAKDAYDGYGVSGGELTYEVMSGRGFNLAFCVRTYDSNDCYYLDSCFNSQYLFGCVGLVRQKYCILNKQYSKETYEQLVPRIIEHIQQTGEWGEGFPAKLALFGYNETIAQEYFPLTKEEALAKGFNWSDYEPPKPDVQKVIPASKLPDNIQDIPDDILNWAIECEVTNKPFRIIKQELSFYREHNLPIPRRHPDQRHKDRMALRNPRKLYERQCDCMNKEHNHPSVIPSGVPLSGTESQESAQRCPTTFQTTYSPDRTEKVYCESCYLKEVY